MQKDNKSNGGQENEAPVEYESLRQLNADRLRFLSGRLGESVESEEEPAAPESPFSNFQASVPDVKPASPLAAMQQKFSNSWLNMQGYLSEKKQQNRNGEHR